MNTELVQSTPTIDWLTNVVHRTNQLQELILALAAIAGGLVALREHISELHSTQSEGDPTPEQPRTEVEHTPLLQERGFNFLHS